MALNGYRIQTRRLLQSPVEPVAFFDVQDLDSWINTARGQVAGEGECIRILGTLTTTPGVSNYNFQSINTGVAATTGVDGIINVRSILYAVGQGYAWITPRSWPWFQLYHQANPVPGSGPPSVWSQFGQGASPDGGSGTAVAPSSFGGSFYLSPPPDISYNLLLDCACYPVALTTDATVEALPYLWTDAVPFLAAWYASLAAPNHIKHNDPQAYFNYYQTLIMRARTFANPGVNRFIYSQSADPAQINKLGLKPQASKQDAG